MFRSAIRQHRLSAVAATTAVALALLTAPAMVTSAAASSKAPVASSKIPVPRPQCPCDIYAAGGTPCVAAHSTTRALYASYDGPLYQVRRLSDNKATDIGIVQPTAKPFVDAGGLLRGSRPGRLLRRHHLLDHQGL